MQPFETKEQVYKSYDDALMRLAETNDAVEKAMKRLLGIFLKGIRYEDENGLLQFSGGIDPASPDFCDEAHAVAAVFIKGQNVILNITKPETAACLMMWYARTRGITADEITALGTNAPSPLSAAAAQKLEYIKQGFADLINSEDPFQLADFYFDAFKKFKRESSLIIKAGTLAGLVKNWPRLVQWVGVTGGLQQSLEDAEYHSTPNQQILLDQLTIKIQDAYGLDMDVRDIISCMQAIDNAFRLMYDAAGNKSLYQLYLRKDEDDKIAEREKLAGALRTFNFLSNITLRGELFSGSVPYPSKVMGKASVVLSYADNLKSGSNLLASEMKYLTGDNSYAALFDLSVPFDFHYAEEELSRVSTLIDLENVHKFIDQRKFDEVFLSGESIADIVKRKAEERTPMSFPEIVLFFSDENPAFNESVSTNLKAFFSMNEAYRLTALPIETRYALEQYCESQLGISAEEYVCGTDSVESYCKTAYLMCTE